MMQSSAGITSSQLHGQQRGLSLIELMVALALGVIIVAALSQLFVNIARTNQEMAKTNSQIETARFGMQFLRNDIVHAGFWGGHVPEFDDISLLQVSPSDYPSVVPDPCLDYSTANWTTEYQQQLVGVPVQLEGGVPGTCDDIIEDRVAGTDVLVVRHAHTCSPETANCDDTGADEDALYFQASMCNDDPEPFLLDPNSPWLDRTCTPGSLAPRRKFVQSIYYVRSWSSDDPDKDGIPTLVRSDFGVTSNVPTQQDAVALVEGIEAFRVELGIDSLSEPYAGFPNGTASDPNEPIDWLDDDNWETARNRGDGIPDGPYVHCPSAGGCTVHQLVNAVAAKLYILARASEATPGYTDTKTYNMGSAAALGPYNDGFKRHVFGTTVRLTNISGRRETP